ncbi:MAG: hypothetical protein ACRC2S_16330 [Waterburya sp.]
MAVNKIGIMYRPIADILQDFNAPINSAIISKKPVFKNRQKVDDIDYIHWYDLVSELHRIAPGWSWEIRTQFLPDRCVIEGRLTIKAAEGEFFMEATGVEPLDSNGFGDPVYSAEASALRRAMAKFGYALDLWRKDTRSQKSEVRSQKYYGLTDRSDTCVLTSQSAKERSSEVDGKTEGKLLTSDSCILTSQKSVTEKQIKLLYAVAKNESGLADEDVKLIIKKWNYESTKDIKMDDFDPILQAIKHAARFLTLQQRKELQQWWREENIQDEVAKRAISGMGFDSTAQILRSQINGVKSGILEQTLVGKN